jgi:hypothetical protein
MDARREIIAPNTTPPVSIVTIAKIRSLSVTGWMSP